MSAQDLARFALLSLQKGNWAGRQIVPEGWVEESTRAYSRSACGSGYGYLRWTDFLGDAVAPTVTLPEGNFLAEGAGGQYALVGPTLDLVVVHRVDRDTAIPRPTARSIARLFWLILKTEGYDPGPDASIGAATGERPKGENLMAKFLGRTISFGAKLKDGPYSMRFELDGRITYLHWDPSFGPAVGTWTIAEDQLSMSVAAASFRWSTATGSVSMGSCKLMRLRRLGDKQEFARSSAFAGRHVVVCAGPPDRGESFLADQNLIVD